MTDELVISPDFDGVHPKNFLSKRINMPYYKILELLKDKRITVNGKKIKKETIFKTGDKIKVWPKEIVFERVGANPSFTPKDMGIPIIFENSDFLILNKPAGVVVQGSQDSEQSITYHLTYLRDKNGDSRDFDYMHVHRIDKETSGILCIGKNVLAVRKLNELFCTREVVKKYVCVCVGSPQNDVGSVEIFLRRNPEGSRQKVGICSENEGKRTISEYRVLKRYQKKGENLSLIEVDLKTGFTHQIRVHMKFLGCPVLGDKMYGVGVINDKLGAKRQFLHAYYLAFSLDGKKYEFNCDYKPEFSSVL